MIATPVRWLLMAGVALCGCVMVVSNEMTTRGFAFLASVLLWQAHYIVMMWEADWMKAAGKKMQQQWQPGTPSVAIEAAKKAD